MVHLSLSLKMISFSIQKGWSHKFDTWEPTKNILDPRLIDNFKKKEEKKKLNNRRLLSNKSNRTNKKYVFFEGDDDVSIDENERTEVKLINSVAPFELTCNNIKPVPSKEDDNSLRDKFIDSTDSTDLNDLNDINDINDINDLNDLNDLNEDDETTDKSTKSINNSTASTIDFNLTNNQLNDSIDHFTSSKLYENEFGKDDDEVSNDCFDESSDNSTDDCTNEIVSNEDETINLKRKIDDSNHEVNKSMKYDLNDQNLNHSIIAQFNNKTLNDKLIIKRMIDKNNNQNEDCSKLIENDDELIYSNGKNEISIQDHFTSNGTNKFKSIKTELLKKKPNYLDSVVSFFFVK